MLVATQGESRRPLLLQLRAHHLQQRPRFEVGAVKLGSDPDMEQKVIRHSQEQQGVGPQVRCVRQVVQRCVGCARRVGWVCERIAGAALAVIGPLVARRAASYEKRRTTPHTQSTHTILSTWAALDHIRAIFGILLPSVPHKSSVRSRCWLYFWGSPRCAPIFVSLCVPEVYAPKWPALHKHPFSVTPRGAQDPGGTPGVSIRGRSGIRCGPEAPR